MAPYLAVAAGRDAHVRGAVDDRDQPDQPRHRAAAGRARCRRLHLPDPGHNRLLDALRWDKDVDPLEWQAHGTALRAGARGPASRRPSSSKRMFEGSGLTVAASAERRTVGARPGR